MHEYYDNSSSDYSKLSKPILKQMLKNNTKRINELKQLIENNNKWINKHARGIFIGRYERDIASYQRNNEQMSRKIASLERKNERIREQLAILDRRSRKTVCWSATFSLMIAGFILLNGQGEMRVQEKESEKVTTSMHGADEDNTSFYLNNSQTDSVDSLEDMLRKLGEAWGKQIKENMENYEPFVNPTEATGPMR